MTTETTQKISRHCDRYGNKLVELMSRCNVYNTLDVPEEDAIRYLKELEEANESASSENHCS